MLGDAIRIAADSFTDDEPGGKAIVVLSDGEDMDSFPIEAAGVAWRDHGARVFTVGIGDDDEGALEWVEVLPTNNGKDGKEGWEVVEARNTAADDEEEDEDMDEGGLLADDSDGSAADDGDDSSSSGSSEDEDEDEDFKNGSGDDSDPSLGGGGKKRGRGAR